MLGLATIIGVLVLLLAACEMMAELLADPALCGSVAVDCGAVRAISHMSPAWPLVIAVAVALLVGVLLVRRVTRPLYDLTAATRAISSGDYSVRVSTRSTDEVGELAAALNQMVEALQSSERRRRELVSNVTHQLRTPLTSIDGYLEGIRDGVFDADPETVRRLLRQTSRLQRLVADLGRLAEVERMEIWPLELAPLNLRRLLEELVESEQPRFAAKGVELRARLPSGSLMVVGDHHSLAQLFANLMDNALLYTDPGGSVRVEASTTAASVAVAVADTGRGIRAEDLPHVLERFYRGEQGHASADGGTGIGLAIVDDVARAHGGRVRVSSDLGRGTRLDVVLPRLRTSRHPRNERAVLKLA